MKLRTTLWRRSLACCLLVATLLALVAPAIVPAAVADKAVEQQLHPPPLPKWRPPGESSGTENAGISYDLRTGKEEILPLPARGDEAADDHTASLQGVEGLAAGNSLNTPLAFSNLLKYDAGQYPYRVNTKLFMTFPDQSGEFICSGILIDPLHVLTAGKCVYAGSWGWASSVRVIPAYDHGDEPFGHADYATLYSFTQWTNDQNWDWNMGLIQLDRPVGALTGWLGYSHKSDSYFEGSTLNNFGYPAFSPYDDGALYGWSGILDDVNEHRMGHNKLGDDGMLGSGAYTFAAGTDDREVHAVYSYHSTADWTYYTRMNEDRFNTIEGWISANTPDQPDLVPLDVVAFPSNVVAGSLLKGLNFTLHNYSSGLWGGTVDYEIYLSTDDVISSADTLLKKGSHGCLVAPKGKERVTIDDPPAVPVDIAGDYWVGVILTSSDSNSANNSTQGWDAEKITISSNAEAGIRSIDLSISLHKEVGTTDRAPYETVIKHFADAIYEMSNGKHKIRSVTIYQDGEQANKADVLWNASEHPRASIAAYARSGQVLFGDEFPFKATYDALDPTNACGAGYTLAHEWGHYYYGLYDEYVVAKGDVAVPNSVMNSQWTACGPPVDPKWLNFSIKKDNTKKTAQHRVYKSSGWETLARPPSEDPKRTVRKADLERPNFAELKAVAPADKKYPTHELPGGQTKARSQLTITWRDPSSSAIQATETYWAFVEVIPGNSIQYPDPVLLMAGIVGTAPLTKVGVEAMVTTPGYLSELLTLKDDGVAPDKLAGDGLYSGYMPYDMDGEYDVWVTFDNDSGQAETTQTGYAWSHGPAGEAYAPSPEPVSDSFSESASTQVFVSGVAADDHSDTPAAATLLTTDNVDVTGQIDGDGDVDVFEVSPDQDGELVLRLSNFAFDMAPKVRLLDSDGSTVIGEYEHTPEDIYFLLEVEADASQTFYVEVSHTDAGATQGLYDISAGLALAGEEELVLRVLVDEAHDNWLSLDWDRAEEIRTEHSPWYSDPDWLYLGEADRRLVPQFRLYRDPEQPLTFEQLIQYDALIIPVHSDALTESEVKAVKRYVASGGGLVLLGDCGFDPPSPELGAAFGIEFNPACLFGPEDPGGGLNGDLAITNFEDHPAVSGLGTYWQNWGQSLSLSGGAFTLANTAGNDAWQDANGNEKQDSQEAGVFDVVAGYESGCGRVAALADNSLNDGALGGWTDNLLLLNDLLRWVSDGQVCEVGPVYLPLVLRVH